MWNSNHYWLGILFGKNMFTGVKKKNGRKNRLILIIVIDTVNAFMSLSLFCFNTNINYWSSLLLWECPLCISSQFCIHFFSNVYHAFVYRALSMALFNNAGFHTTLSSHCTSQKKKQTMLWRRFAFGVRVQICQLHFHHVGARNPF